MSWLAGKRLQLLLFGCGLLVYGLVAGARLATQSPDPHFVYQADAWLHGRLDIGKKPKKGDDMAFVDAVRLDDGSEVRGRRLFTERKFMTTGGQRIDVSRVRRNLGRTYYVSFPPAPALLMLPSAVLAGPEGNDVIPTVLAAALILPLMFSTLRRLAADRLSERTVVDDLWLVSAYAFGSVFFFCAVQGRVWFTAHVVGSLMAWCYLYFSVGARRPIAAGTFLALAALSRIPLAFAFPIFAFEAWRVADGDRRRLLSSCAKFAAPVMVFIVVAVAFNLARWDDPLEFGHRFLHVRQQNNIEVHGLFSSHYLLRNLQVAFTMIPCIGESSPYLRIGGHGLAIWLTSPILLWALWPRKRTHLHIPLWITSAIIIGMPLFYQNTGWFQFGYRFAADALPFLFLLIAMGARPLGKLARAAIVAGIVINLFGAVTFNRYQQFYRTDMPTYQLQVRC
ncbi:MAG: hypothetical protein KJO07_14780 [Deltaproteobacteria bacterium]|nr:hypothetical protein [Deltaproteobacteria bacterium]